MQQLHALAPQLLGLRAADASRFTAHLNSIKAQLRALETLGRPVVAAINGPSQLVVAGGVAANVAIGSALTVLAESHDFNIRIPPARLCTDNAAMIAWAGVERLSANAAADPISVSPRARWPLATGPI